MTIALFQTGSVASHHGYRRHVPRTMLGIGYVLHHWPGGRSFPATPGQHTRPAGYARRGGPSCHSRYLAVPACLARKGGRWCIAKYWRLERGRWDFGTPTGPTLVKHQATAHHRHVKVRGARSLFDGDWVYWSIRLGRHPELPIRVARLLRRQRGRCARCGLFFRDGDLPEIDHVIPRKLGGPDGYSNWQLLHRHCHDQKTADDAVTVSMTTDQFTEEPDEGKLSRPVCAVRRFVASLMQLGGTWRSVPGLPGLPERESARGPEHARKAVAVWRRPG